MSERADLTETIARMEAALQILWSGAGSEAVKALCSHEADVSAFLGMGAYEQGWEEVSRRWDWAAGVFRGGSGTFQPISTIATETLACTTTIERLRVQVAGADSPTELANRVTQVFRREGETWRLVHRHASRLEAQTPVSGGK